MTRRVIDTKHLTCKCGQCPTSAKVTYYDCGCVRVRVINDRDPCSECSNFTGMNYTAPQCR